VGTRGDEALATKFEARKETSAMTTVAEAPSTTHARVLHRPVDTGPAYWGPGDHYRFLVTGEETGGAYFVMEALVPAGGGPPPHIHRREDETFYLVEGEIVFTLGEETITAGRGDFVNVPKGTVHNFHNAGTETARLVLTFTPAGIERFFEETLERAPNGAQDPPDNIEEVAARYVAASPRHGIEFV
jgi:quercetin dioxygenase-like cupin family protein